MKEYTATLELNRKELTHLQNDVISYIYGIKKRVFGEAWSFGCALSEEEQALLTPEREQKLKEYDYYSRLELHHKLRAFEAAKFHDYCECCEG